MGGTVGRGAITAGDFLGVGFLGGIAGFTSQTLPTHIPFPSAPYLQRPPLPPGLTARVDTSNRPKQHAASSNIYSNNLPTPPVAALRHNPTKRAVRRPGGRGADGRWTRVGEPLLQPAGWQRERDPRLAARSERSPPPGRACLPVPYDAHLPAARAGVQIQRKRFEYPLAPRPFFFFFFEFCNPNRCQGASQQSCRPWKQWLREGCLRPGQGEDRDGGRWRSGAEGRYACAILRMRGAPDCGAFCEVTETVTCTASGVGCELPVRTGARAVFRL